MELVAAGYLGLFVSAFAAATLFPFYSEIAVVAMVQSGSFDTLAVWAVATVGNTLGSLANWVLGRWLHHFEGRRWFPIKRQQLHRAEVWFNRYGYWSLLFAWLPWGGDPLTFVAGLLRVDVRIFLLLVGFGKAARYAVVILAVTGLAEIAA